MYLYARLLMVFEAPASRIPGNTSNHVFFEVCLYHTYVVMTTVGYGDVTCYTFLGRLVIFVAALSGMSIISMLVLIINNNIQLSEAESNVIYTLKRSHNKSKILQQKAANSIVRFMKLILVYRRSENQETIQSQIYGLKKSLEDFMTEKQ